MGRLEAIKRDKLRIIFLIAVTASLPLIIHLHNTKVAPELAIFWVLTMVGWLDVAVMLLVSDNFRYEFYKNKDEVL